MKRMRVSSRWRSLLACCALALPAHAWATVLPCEFPDDADAAGGLRQRIAETACREHADWYAPFINAEGRVGWQDGHIPMEAEGGIEKLASGSAPWRRVAEYWRSTPALDNLRGAKGAKECAAPTGEWLDDAACRAFILDHPWSAAFVSYVMKRAGVDDFAFSAEHITYLRAAHAAKAERPRYRLVAPERERPEVGDLLCYSREARVATHADLVAFLDAGGIGLKTHCDIVVGVDLDGDRKLYTIGGNVLQTVMLRKLPLNAAGRFVPPRAAPEEATCRINRERACSLNAKAWIALLKLRD